MTTEKEFQVAFANKLREYLATNPEGYKLDSHGIIRDLGKFQGEPLYVPYFHGLTLEGCSDRKGGDVQCDTAYDLFELTDADRAAHSDFSDPLPVTVLAILEDSQGFVTCELWEGDTLDEVEASYEPIDEDEFPQDDEPCEGDYTLNPCGPLGSRTYAAQYGYPSRDQQGLGEFKTPDEALAAIREHANKAQFFPNVWSISDHGNAHLIEDFSYESRGTWIAEGCEDSWCEEEQEFAFYNLTIHVWGTLKSEGDNALAIKRELISIAGATIEQPDGGTVLHCIVTDLDAAREELRLANFALEVRP